MNEHVEAQQRHDVGGVNLGRWIGSEGWYFDDTIEQTGSAQYLIECSKGGLPPSDRIALRAMRLGRERPKEKYVMETDYMLQHSSGVPLSAWRLGLPMITDETDLVAERPTGLPMPIHHVV